MHAHERLAASRRGLPRVVAPDPQAYLESRSYRHAHGVHVLHRFHPRCPQCVVHDPVYLPLVRLHRQVRDHAPPLLVYVPLGRQSLAQYDPVAPHHRGARVVAAALYPQDRERPRPIGKAAECPEQITSVPPRGVNGRPLAPIHGLGHADEFPSGFASGLGGALFLLPGGLAGLAVGLDGSGVRLGRRRRGFGRGGGRGRHEERRRRRRRY
mmetsp:Transcript_21631/g.43720  ORF Transcript_21631/g.43720 Transcript_21631/m.43720 type:complete len:211 (+) Transcript_21631:784-1416(+)